MIDRILGYVGLARVKYVEEIQEDTEDSYDMYIIDLECTIESLKNINRDYIKHIDRLKLEISNTKQELKDIKNKNKNYIEHIDRLKQELKAITGREQELSDKKVKEIFDYYADNVWLDTSKNQKKATLYENEQSEQG